MQKYFKVSPGAGIPDSPSSSALQSECLHGTPNPVLTLHQTVLSVATLSWIEKTVNLLSNDIYINVKHIIKRGAYF